MKNTAFPPFNNAPLVLIISGLLLSGLPSLSGQNRSISTGPSAGDRHIITSQDTPPSQSQRTPTPIPPDRPAPKPQPPPQAIIPIPPKQPQPAPRPTPPVLPSPKPEPPPRDNRPRHPHPPPVYYTAPQTVVIDNTTTIVQQGNANSLDLSFPNAVLFQRYRTTSRTIKISREIENKGVQPVVSGTQVFPAGPKIRWEINPVMPGRDLYEFWVEYPAKAPVKVDFVYYGYPFTIWNDGDLLIVLGNENTTFQ